MQSLLRGLSASNTLAGFGGCGEVGGQKCSPFGLATGLADAYQVATGRQATIPYDAYKEINHGPFLDLVEAVLPLTAELAQGLGEPLHFPKRRHGLVKYLLREIKHPHKPPARASHADAVHCLNSSPSAPCRGRAKLQPLDL
jgi:hypothetical protein